MQSEDEWHKQRTYDSLMSYGTSSIKSVLLLNGAAAISILTFVGHHPDRIISMKMSMMFFILGTFLGALANLGAYFTQFSLYNEDQPEPAIWYWRHTTWLWLTVIVILLGYFSFAAGSAVAVYSLA